MWVRGLKPVGIERIEWSSDVAPHVGAWIETLMVLVQKLVWKSHPMWVRGLKRDEYLAREAARMSHPMWVRGLKQVIALAWGQAERRTPCGCVD